MRDTGVRFKDIAGLTHIIVEMQEVVKMLLNDPAYAKVRMLRRNWVGWGRRLRCSCVHRETDNPNSDSELQMAKGHPSVAVLACARVVGRGGV